MKKNKETPTLKQIVKTTLSFIAVAMVLAGVVIGILTNWMPRAVKLLPIPLIVASIAILLILKSTGKSMDSVIPPPEELPEDEPPAVTEGTISEEQNSASEHHLPANNKKEPD